MSSLFIVCSGCRLCHIFCIFAVVKKHCSMRGGLQEGCLFAPEDFAVVTDADECEPMRHDFDGLFARLSASEFRMRFRLKPDDIGYIDGKGLAVISRHAADFVRRRLAPAFIPNDGRQTPMRGHPVFIAQHATGCCCRGCLVRWHGIPAGRELTENEQRYVVAVLMEWIRRQL